MAMTTSALKQHSDVKSTDAAVQMANARLSEIRKSLDLVTDRIGRILSRAFGESPTECSAAQPCPVPSGELGMMDEHLDALASIAAEQSGLLSRLDRIV